MMRSMLDCALSIATTRLRRTRTLLGNLVLATIVAGCTSPPHGWIPYRREFNDFCNNCQCGRMHCPPGPGVHAHGGEGHESAQEGGLLSGAVARCRSACSRHADPYSGECTCACPDDCGEACSTDCRGEGCKGDACHDHHAGHKKHALPKLYDPEAGIFNFCTPPIALMATPPPPPGRFFPVPVRPVFSPQPTAYGYGYGSGEAGAYGAGYGPAPCQ